MNRAKEYKELLVSRYEGRTINDLRRRLYRKGTCWSCAAHRELYRVILWVDNVAHDVCADCSWQAIGWGLSLIWGITYLTPLDFGGGVIYYQLP